VTTSSGSPTSVEPGSAVGLDGPASGVPGAGPVTAARLRALGIETVRDLLLRLPRRYDDLRRATSITALGEVADGTVVLVRGTVRRVHVFPRRLLDVTVEHGGAELRARWFRPPGTMAKSFVKGSPVALAGPVRTADGGVREILHPTVVTAALAARDPAGAGGLGLRPRYPATPGIGGRAWERLAAAALSRAAAGAPSGGSGTELEALRAVHAPPDDLDDAALSALREGRSPAHRQLTIEALAIVQAAFLLRRAEARAVPAPAPVRLSDEDVTTLLERIGAAFDFALTAEQAAAVRQIARDLAAPAPMQRLLIGDVGSGKTAVALAAAVVAATGGGQTLMMVPTEVLAEQHARTLGPVAARLGLSIGLLTAATPRPARAALQDACAAGRVQLLVGTQALLTAGLRPADLRLCIVDEQHRFGVAQRARLGRPPAAGPVDERGSDAPGAPHLLVLSATPIPRTLALALHGDLDASVLAARPAGRLTPDTVICTDAAERRAALQRLRAAVAEGRQGFVVCPVREQAVRADAVTAVGRHAALRRELAPARVGLLHGALDAAEKERTLRAFAAGTLDVLVATTVVELGIDVPNATVMIVEDADRFGLAQLHQLRGRVGRGAVPGLCLLCASASAVADSDGMARLRELAALGDGFRLAEADLARRGFGDVFGTQQAGAAVMGPGDPREMFALIAAARAQAEAVLAVDPTLARPENAALARAARARVAARDLFAGEAG
jgi:ATP-dependent DNA helicase RecG